MSGLPRYYDAVADQLGLHVTDLTCLDMLRDRRRATACLTGVASIPLSRTSLGPADSGVLQDLTNFTEVGALSGRALP